MNPTSGSGIGNVTNQNTLVEMAMGYARSRALCAAARLEIGDVLGDAGGSLDEVAARCGADPKSLGRLLRALASFGVVAETEPGSFKLTTFGAPLRKDAPASVWAAIIFWADLLADQWAFLPECIKSGEPAAKVMGRKGVPTRWSTEPDAPAIFRAVMGTAPAENYMSIVRAWDFSRARTVADLGGGGGSLLAAILQAYPQVRGMLVDRPESVERARAAFDSNGLGARCRLVTADLCKEIPADADVYVLKHVLHGYADEAASEILRNCRAVVGTGRLLIVEFVLPETVTAPDPELERRLMSDLNMLVVTGGRERTRTEWSALLDRAGFKMEQPIPVAGESVSVMEVYVTDADSKRS